MLADALRRFIADYGQLSSASPCNSLPSDSCGWITGTPLRAAKRKLNVKC
jgi:hypothetical protein